MVNTYKALYIHYSRNKNIYKHTYTHSFNPYNTESIKAAITKYQTGYFTSLCEGPLYDLKLEHPHMVGGASNSGVIFIRH